MKALVTRMKNPESQLPVATPTAARKCVFGPSRFSPQISAPMKALSRKKANMPSIASVWPMIPPAYLVKPAQFVPNWNSIGMPVTTPMAKFSPKTFAQKRAARLYCSSPVRKARHFQYTRNQANPMVSWGKR